MPKRKNKDNYIKIIDNRMIKIERRGYNKINGRKEN